MILYSNNILDSTIINWNGVEYTRIKNGKKCNICTQLAQILQNSF